MAISAQKQRPAVFVAEQIWDPRNINPSFNAPGGKKMTEIAMR